MQGVVQDKNTSNKLPGALVKLYDENNKLIAEAIADKNGFYTFKLEKNKTYKIIATNNLYVPTEEVLTTNDSKNPKENINLKLERFEDKEENIVVENNKLQIKIAPIYFDFDKWDIRPDAALELDNVVSIMKKYPTMVIEIGAHTDFRGDEDYNLMLSDKRAQSVRDYLVSQGISNDNVKSVGYGETQPINNCTKPGICSKESYSLNRRCEFVILN